MRTREILVWIGIALLVMTLSGALIYSCNKPRDIFAEATDHLNTADDLIKEVKILVKRIKNGTSIHKRERRELFRRSIRSAGDSRKF